MKKLRLVLFLVTLISFALFPSQIFAQNIDPQYIFVRKDPMSCNPSDCSQLWNMDAPNKDFYPGITDVYNKVGTHGNDQRKLGIGVQIIYNEYNFDNIKQSLRSLLNYSKVHSVPIFLSLDGFQWWGDVNQWNGRPDLWNWWDLRGPGYNPDNKNNVEWTCGNSSCAINKSWRNWGSEFEVRPHPNLASRAFIEADKQRLSELIPIIVNWYNNDLSADQKWLLGGIALGTEVDIGGNYYYPGGGIANSQQLGFAAINTLGLSGGITAGNLNEVIRRYLSELDKFAFDSGILRNKIFNHVGGSDLFPRSNNLMYQTAEAAVNAYGNPGWSFYSDVTQNPQNFSGLTTALNQVNNGEWASPEWLTWAGDNNGWAQALRNSLNYRNNRFINIANWEGIRDKQYILDALKTVLGESPSCWVTTPYMDNVSISGNTATLQWQKGTNNDAVYLNVSTAGEFTEAGTLKVINTVNDAVTDRNSYTMNSLGSGKYYWTLAADGCTNQRKIASGRFEIASATPTPFPGDLNGDNKVDIFDYNVLVANFGKTGAAGWIAADINSDGKVDIFDYNVLVGNFGK
ncbi:hypothetical protein HZB96_04860 [Candidatus Gottesmanbacteria bacterium]|nr:hypothetical protein [Candidatus Gottesmanbacteria bacterium]